MSHNHQYIQLSEKIVARYTKTIPGIITGYRSDPFRPENRIDWLLKTPETNFLFVPDERGVTKLVRKDFSYDDEVIELYSTDEVKLFQRWNKGLLESGVLVLYEDKAPDIDTTNILTDTQVTEIAATKQLLALRKKIAALTSIHSLQRIEKAAEELDRPFSIIKAIQERIHELSGNNQS